ncbi:MAG: riboflavin kinase, partial [Pleopsidium flavum]
EVHILHAFTLDFYSAHMNLLILGFIRPEYDYVSKESLIEDIRSDIEVARRSLEREAWRCWREDAYLRVYEGEGHGGDVGR